MLGQVKKFFTDTKQVIRLVVLIFCICVSCYQLIGCINKVQNPPTSTHYKFALNETLKYPPITICRNPGFKRQLFENFGLPEMSSLTLGTTWKMFNFENFTLEQFFEETTFSYKEAILIASLDQLTLNLNISSFFTLTYGRCYKIVPNVLSNKWGVSYGYFLLFNNIDNITDFAGSSINSPGFHITIQNENDEFSEKSEEANVFNEYLYVKVGDSFGVSLKMNKYHQLPSSERHCDQTENYSHSKCVEDETNRLISETVKCNTPWIPNSNLPPCNTYNETYQIVTYSTPSTYLTQFLGASQCPMKCNITTYAPFLHSIQTITPPNCAVSIHFTSNLYTLMEEVVGYDWNSFLADLGGSLGFFLGLSVLGAIALAEQMLSLMITKARPSHKNGFDVTMDPKTHSMSPSKY